MENNPILDHQNAERILEEAWILFQQKGYRGVTVDELCRRCNLTKPTLYYYFQDKETLFVQVLQYKLHGFRAVIEQPGTIPERLERTAQVILESFLTEYSTLLRDREHIKEPANLDKIRQAFRSELFDPLNSLMQSGLETGELAAETPETLTLVFLGIINNFISRAAEMPGSKLPLARKLTGYFLHGAQKVRLAENEPNL